VVSSLTSALSSDCGHEHDRPFAVLDNRISFFEISQRHFVANGYVLLYDHREVGIILCDDAEHLIASLEVLDNDDAALT
jgi:hypothetical protein